MSIKHLSYLSSVTQKELKVEGLMLMVENRRFTTRKTPFNFCKTPFYDQKTAVLHSGSYSLRPQADSGNKICFVNDASIPRNELL